MPVGLVADGGLRGVRVSELRRVGLYGLRVLIPEV